ncbi:glutamate--cysteine ligase [Schaalia suimastitidis]|uniref:glutamate--cysteine ligase n=1 Tax=Schaalia suimastitidis TaxID=121163 RepID=UPI000407F717|nr:glutamate--cysteine ligase [Schaalia suimastitidis]
MPLDFSSSRRSTIGVEWELQLVDQDSNDLRQSADAVIARAVLPDGSPHGRIHREMLLNTVEFVSGAHNTVAECMHDLLETAAFLRPVTNELRIDLAAAGTHPFAMPTLQRVTDSQRYADLVERTQYWGRQMLLYGVHVHVGVEARTKVLPIASALATWIGHLQAISASSPVWAGIDTGYASNRAMVFQQLPTAGIPRHFDHWEELEAYTADMIHTGVINSFDEVRWDIRPSPKWGTLENRVFDAASNILEVGAFAALTHCLVELYSREIDADHVLPRLPDWFIAENKWRSARYGLDAELIVDARGTQEDARQGVERLLHLLAPVARDLGCVEELASVEEILRCGAAYDRQRYVAAHATQDPLDSVVEFMRAEMRADRPLDPRIFVAQLAMARGEGEPHQESRGARRA